MGNRITAGLAEEDPFNNKTLELMRDFSLRLVALGRGKMKALIAPSESRVLEVIGFCGGAVGLKNTCMVFR